MSCNKGDSRQSNKENHFQVSNWWWCHHTACFSAQSVARCPSSHEHSSSLPQMSESVVFVSLYSPLVNVGLSVRTGLSFRSARVLWTLEAAVVLGNSLRKLNLSSELFLHLSPFTNPWHSMTVKRLEMLQWLISSSVGGLCLNFIKFNEKNLKNH